MSDVRIPLDFITCTLCASNPGKDMHVSLLLGNMSKSQDRLGFIALVADLTKRRKTLNSSQRGRVGLRQAIQLLLM